MEGLGQERGRVGTMRPLAHGNRYQIIRNIYVSERRGTRTTYRVVGWRDKEGPHSEAKGANDL